VILNLKPTRNFVDRDLPGPAGGVHSAFLDFLLGSRGGFPGQKKDTKGRRVNLTKGEGKRGKKKGKAKKGRGRTRFSTGTFIFVLPVLLLNNF